MHTNTSDIGTAALASLASLINKEKLMSEQPTTTPTVDQPVTKAPRQSHSPAEKATEAVNVLQRRLDKLTKSRAAFELQALELEPQIEAMQKRLDYANTNPDLPKHPADVVVGPIDIPELRGQEFAKAPVDEAPLEIWVSNPHAIDPGSNQVGTA
jgi:hypothetical protein